MLLQDKNAVIYGAGGSLGGTIARAFAKEGAHVFVTGHREAPLQALATAITRSGGKATIAVVDGLEEPAIRAHLLRVVETAGTVDISINLIGLEDTQDLPLTEMDLEDFLKPIHRAMRSHFLTATAAARIMQQQHSGVILSLTATPGGIGYPLTGGFGPACSAIEGFSRNLASELGIYGIRVVNIRSAGSPDSKVFRDFMAVHPALSDKVLGNMRNDTMLKELPLMQDIADTAVFLCSGNASRITGTTIDLTVGTTSALNYHVQQPVAGSNRAKGGSSFFNPKYQ
ncbi:SDR family oxidoreductase [Niabella sp. CC-SYL272]|uniref:SDR family NAD(P)-dependent oxidoreductase n=1 Tax=Niabella agricola TaxID=2891571 RepID=UPI001F1E8FA8|nr:SDR family oxidoreductase [Niabella agricola]MCF3107890.1 SDR family oxidoreductase [Niabella agricola]